MNTKQALSLSLAALMVLSVVAFTGATAGVANAAKGVKETKPKLDTPTILTPATDGLTDQNPIQIVEQEPVAMAWSAVSGATNYSIGVDTLTDGEWQPAVGVNGLPTTSTSLNVGLFSSVGASFRWNVTAIGDRGTSTPSDYRYYTVVAGTLPATPLVSPDKGDVINAAAGVSKTFTWDPVPGADTYSIAFIIVTLPPSGSGSFSNVQSIGPIDVGNTPTYTTTLAFPSSPSGSYLGWQVMAKDNDVGTSWTTYRMNGLIDKLTPPVITSPQDGARLKAGEFTFSWTAVPGALGSVNYEGKMTSSDGTVLDSGIIPQTSTTLTLHGLKGDTFKLSVRAVYGTGTELPDLNSDWSTVTVTVK